MNDKGDKGEIIAEGRVANKWVLQSGKSNIILVPHKQHRAEYYSILALTQMPIAWSTVVIKNYLFQIAKK